MYMEKRPKYPFEIPIKLSKKEVDELFESLDPLRKYLQDDIDELNAVKDSFDPIDFPYLYSLKDEVIVPVVDNYFRAELIGADKIPQTGPLIMASNHSGNAFPHDAIMLDGLIWRKNDFRKNAKFRSVFSPSLTSVWWMRPFGIDNWWRRCGGIDMTFDNFDYLMQNQHKVIYYPEGIPGIGKGFTRKYQLQHFYSSFVILAARYNVPIYPVYTVNAEWVNPISITFKWIDYLSSKYLKIPFFPIPIVFLALIFPFMFYLAFPANIKYVIGDPIDVKKIMNKMGIDTQYPDKEDYDRTAETIRDHMQIGLNEAVKKYGQSPYDFKNWYRKMKNMGWKAIKYSPLGWPFIFIRHERNLKRKPASNGLIRWLRDLDIVSYYLPFGWILLALFRQIRKPPYGYRGLTKEERKRAEGKYLCSLKEHPLFKSR